MKAKELIKRYLLFTVGTFFIGLGVGASKLSNLGISPVSSVANVLSIKFDFLTVGSWVFLWNCILILAQIVILKRDFQPIQFLQIAVSFLLGLFTDIGVAIFANIPAETYIIKLLLVFLGILLIGFGISLTVISDSIMNVAESLVKVIAGKTGKNFGTVKVIFDVSSVVFSIILSLIFFNFRIVGTREGTVITALLVGNVVKFFVKHIKNPTEKLLGLSE